MNKAQRLQEMIDNFADGQCCSGDYCSCNHSRDHKTEIEKFKKQILSLFMECVPEERNPYKTNGGQPLKHGDTLEFGETYRVSYEDLAFNQCRAEMLKNIEELRGDK